MHKLFSLPGQTLLHPPKADFPLRSSDFEGQVGGQAKGLLLFLGGLLLTILACGILVTHAERFSLKRDEAIAIGTALPELKARVALLRVSVGAEKLFTEEGLASREEQADVYVLPTKSPAPRIAKIAEDIGSSLGEGFRVERIDFATARDALPGPHWDGRIVQHIPEMGWMKSDPHSGKILPVMMRLHGTFQQVSRFLAILGMSGRMTVKDVLPEAVQEEFLGMIEDTAPLSLERAAAFLYLDLLSYAANADEEEQRVLDDLPEEAAGEIRSLLLSAGLGGVRAALGGVAADLRSKNMWPLPLLRTDSLVRKGESWEIGMMGFYR